MSKPTYLRALIAVIIAQLLWIRAYMELGTIEGVLSYCLAGTLSGLGLVWIAREFASRTFSRHLAASSAITGFLLLTPIVAMLFHNATERTTAAIVLAVVAAGAAALVGATWGVTALADQAFDEWRDKKRTAQRLGFEGGR